MEIVSLQKQKNQVVVKSNKLVEAKYKLTLNEQRLILLLTSLIKPEDEEFKEYLINLNDLKKMLEIKSNDFNRQIKDVTDSLVTKLLVIKEYDGDLRTAWLSSAKYFDNEGCVALSFAPRLKPYLLQLKNHFTTYELDKVIKFKSTYSIRLYELLLKEYNFYKKERNVFIYTLEDLKEKLGIGKKEYAQIGEFKRFVLDPAKKELKEKSELYFDYESIKTKRTITDIKFSIKIKKSSSAKIDKQQTIIDFTPNNEVEEVKQEDDEITKKLKEWGTIKIDEIRSRHSDEVFLDAFKYIDFETERKKKEGKEPIKSLGAYLNKILPEAGKPFEFTKDYKDHIVKQEKIKTQLEEEKRRQEEEEKRKKEKEKQKEELEKKIFLKIEDLKNSSPDEWAELEAEAIKKVEDFVKPPKQEKEVDETIKKVLQNLDENTQNRLKKEALEKTKEKIRGLGIDEEHKVFNITLKSSTPNTLNEIMRAKYQDEIKEELKNSPSYKAYKQLFDKQLKIAINNLIAERFFS